MSYLDRLQDLKYTSPSGKSFTLFFDELSRSGGKKVVVVEFPGQDTGAVQELGELTPTFSITCYLTGPDYDTEADRFNDALREPGAGQLQHPRWGTLAVIPASRKQSEAYIDGAGRAVFEIDFIKTDDAAFVYPRSASDPQLKVGVDVETAAENIETSAGEVEITDLGEKATLRKNSLDSLTKFRDGMKKVSARSAEISRDIRAQIRKIEREIDTYILAPADLMSELLTLYRLPAAVVTDVAVKVAGYATVYDSLIDGYRATTALYGERLGILAVAGSNAILAAAAEASATGTITTRAQASKAIQDLSVLSALVGTEIDALGVLGDFQADYESQKSVNIAVTRAINSLFERALNLPTEQAMVMERAVSPLELVYELYGDIDRLDEFIAYNDLQGDEIFQIPLGREVRWYA